ncbi:CG13472 [Drosophila busckii]|uniref:Tudor domain-containing protein 3 n=1 Tax=Drosophila busckii TaxID=30019 RepID=A0A0M4EZI3_DROBS|nr:CG13472 [Drosophila busckii]
MELSKKLQACGWYLTDEGIKSIKTHLGVTGEPDPRKIIDEALNRDLREIGSGALPSKRDDINGTLGGRIVLQVLRVRNVSAPKSNEESNRSPRLLQLELSDGQNSVQAIELDPVPALSINVAPGTKIFFKAERLQLMHGFLLLRSDELQLLGGRVDALYEKWDFTRTMLKYTRSGRPVPGSTNPPPWIKFGQNSAQMEEPDRNFKSLQAASDKDKAAKENAEFTKMRNDAIAEASKPGPKKVFGGGGQYMADHNMKKILDKGYTKEEAKTALLATRNNLERALFNLKRGKDGQEAQAQAPLMRGRGERREGKRGATLKEEAEAAKPAANATLFDFLTTKLPTDALPETTKTSATANNKTTLGSKYTESNISMPEIKFQGSHDRSRFENNVSSSFAANRGGHYGSLSRGGGGGGGGGPRNRGGRDERPTRGRGTGYNERPGPPPAATTGAIRKQPQMYGKPEQMHSKPEQAHVKPEQTHGKQEQQHGKSVNRNAPDSATKQTAEPKSEPDVAPAKDTRNNNRGRGDNGQNRGRRNGPPPPKSSTSTNDDAARLTQALMPKIIEDTASLKISAPKRENNKRGGKQTGGQQSNRPQSDSQAQAAPVAVQAQKPMEKPKQAASRHQQQQHQQPKQTNERSQSSQLANGYTYDPSKIMGFQSKEANDFAMSLLKSQGVSIPNKQTPGQSMSISMAISIHSAAALMPQPAVVQAPPEQYGQMPGANWVWKPQDLCMAKYWDDGQYYEAQVTGVSATTCVVYFIGYGNHEEVLKSDILPITDEQNRPLSSQHQQSHRDDYQQQQSPFRGDRGNYQPQQQSHYRGDRESYQPQQQVYIPPHQRRN